MVEALAFVTKGLQFHFLFYFFLLSPLSWHGQRRSHNNNIGSNNYHKSHCHQCHYCWNYNLVLGLINNKREGQERPTSLSLSSFSSPSSLSHCHNNSSQLLQQKEEKGGLQELGTPLCHHHMNPSSLRYPKLKEHWEIHKVWTSPRIRDSRANLSLGPPFLLLFSKF